jgi:hypothetical protein
LGDGTIEPLIEVGPRAAEIDKAAAVGAEDEIAAFLALTRLEDRERLRHEQDVVRPSVFGSLARQANERRLWMHPPQPKRAHGFGSGRSAAEKIFLFKKHS